MPSEHSDTLTPQTFALFLPPTHRSQQWLYPQKYNTNQNLKILDFQCFFTWSSSANPFSFSDKISEKCHQRKKCSSYLLLSSSGTPQTLASFSSTSSCCPAMVSDSPFSSQCATCQLVPFSATSPSCSSRLCRSRWLNLGLSCSRLQHLALFSVVLLSGVTSRLDFSRCLSIRQSVQRRRFSLPCLLIWLLLRGRLGLHMLLLFPLLLGLWLQVG